MFVYPKAIARAVASAAVAPVSNGDPFTRSEPVVFMSPSTSNVNAGPTELIPTLVVGIPMTLTIVPARPTFNRFVVVIPETKEFDALENPIVAIPDMTEFPEMVALLTFKSPPLKARLPLTSTSPLK